MCIVAKDLLQPYIQQLIGGQWEHSVFSSLFVFVIVWFEQSVGREHVADNLS